MHENLMEVCFEALLEHKAKSRCWTLKNEFFHTIALEINEYEADSI